MKPPYDALMPLPKAELHLHIEGTLEPELAFALAARNGVSLPYADEDALREAYRFADLQSFLNLYYELMAVLRTERDFEDLANAYLARAAAQGVRHAEIFFDPQAHLARGVEMGTVVEGLWRALGASR
ncbi:adenosine deaminase, partial [Streptomyces sp. SID5926]|nr:adenosine deaminase [Streptomyces sp. SID5926]